MVCSEGLATITIASFPRSMLERVGGSADGRRNSSHSAHLQGFNRHLNSAATMLLCHTCDPHVSWSLELKRVGKASSATFWQISHQL